jgi:hypothetical protein
VELELVLEVLELQEKVVDQIIIFLVVAAVQLMDQEL